MQLLEWDHRVADFLELAVEFIEETEYPINYSFEHSVNYTYKLINDPNTAIFIHYINNDIAGLIITHYDNEFQEENFGYISKMYVSAKYRGTRTGRALLAEATEWFDKNDCILSFATATAAIGQDKLYTNLLGKFGFVPEGMVLIRKGNKHE